MVESCPYCGSEDIYYSKKKKLFVCEDCDRTFTENETMQKPDAPQDAGLKIFFSYGHDRNRFLVERIKSDFEKRGHHVWIDSSEIKAGDNWRDDIANGLMNSSSVIAFLSEYSTRNPGVCLDELKIAVCVKGATIKTVLMEPETRVRQPSTISDIQWLDMSDWYDIKQKSEEQFELWYKERFVELCNLVESSESKELIGDIHWLKSILNPFLNTEKEYGLLSKSFYGRKWLDEYIDNWQDRTDSKALIIYGKPGSGKSAFAVNYSHYNSDVLGLFLCEWNREYSIIPGKLIRTMAFKLATKMADYRKMLIHQLSDKNLSLDSMEDEELFEYLISFPLNHLVDGNRETGLIIVDGLDEAEKDGSNSLARLFERCTNNMPRFIKFIFTSRPENNVKQYFHKCDAVDIIEDMPEGYNDIKAYLIQSLPDELRRISNQLETLNRISNLSEGIFLYAELLVADIKADAIDIQHLGEIPRGLNSFYRASFERKYKTLQNYEDNRIFLELLCISDTIPEILAAEVCSKSQYEFLKNLDLLGTLVARSQDDGLFMLSFSHKSVEDWLTDQNLSGNLYVDNRHGALLLANYCRHWIEEAAFSADKKSNGRLDSYIREHIGQYYIIAESYSELEEFLIKYANELSPYWNVWNQFPDNWNHTKLLVSFWASEERNSYLKLLQREGNTRFVLWILVKAEDAYGIKRFDQEVLSIYMDIVHLSGNYAKAVGIADDFLSGRKQEDIISDDFLLMLSIRKIHHQMFYRPVGKLLDNALALYALIDDRFPQPYNELLFLIGGNLGVLNGQWDLCKEYLKKSEETAAEYCLQDFPVRNTRKIADCLCRNNEYAKAIAVIENYLPANGEISNRYEAYLTGALANVYTCVSQDDEALELYNTVLQYAMVKGITGWVAHANLGIANINFKLGNLKEAIDFATRAYAIYRRICQEWGLIMSEAMLRACESRMGVAPLNVACSSAVKRAEKMQYGSCVESIETLCEQDTNYFKLYFI